MLRATTCCAGELAFTYDYEQLMMRGLANKEILLGDVVILRYQEGHKSGSGSLEVLTPTSAMGVGLGDKVELATDGRFSGGSGGFCPWVVSSSNRVPGS